MCPKILHNQVYFHFNTETKKFKARLYDSDKSRYKEILNVFAARITDLNTKDDEPFIKFLAGHGGPKGDWQDVLRIYKDTYGYKLIRWQNTSAGRIQTDRVLQENKNGLIDDTFTRKNGICLNPEDGASYISPWKQPKEKHDRPNDKTISVTFDTITKDLKVKLFEKELPKKELIKLDYVIFWGTLKYGIKIKTNTKCAKPVTKIQPDDQGKYIITKCKYKNGP